jgi:hypothetical protein
MRRRIHLTTLYDKARTQLNGIKYDVVPPEPWPEVCQFTLDELLTEARGNLERRLRETASDNGTVARS